MFAATSNGLTTARAQLVSQLGQNLPWPTPQVHGRTVALRNRGSRRGPAPCARSPHPSGPRVAQLEQAHLARASFRLGKTDILLFRAQISEGTPPGWFRTVGANDLALADAVAPAAAAGASKPKADPQDIPPLL